MGNEQKNNWWIFKGINKEDTKALEKREDSGTKPRWRMKDEDNRDNIAKAYMGLQEEVLNAINAAIYLRRPLLISGNPGVGKSSLAKAIAYELCGAKKPLLTWYITSKSKLEDGLYVYDALARLQDIQMQHLYRSQNNTEEADKIKTEIGKYIKLGVLGQAFVEESTRVVLIDEIDKSDYDLPNDLLHIFEEQEFSIDEIKRAEYDENIEIDGMSLKKLSVKEDGIISCREDFPIIIMTSNKTKTFPPAFLRRCISVELELPVEESEKVRYYQEMLYKHFDITDNEKEKSKLKDLVKEFVDLNAEDQKLRSNDQLLNAAYIVLNTQMDFNQLKNTILKPLEE